MNDLLILFAGLGALAAILANIAVWAPRRLWIKLGALATTAVFLPAGYLALAEMLGRPKPIKIEWARQELAEASVLSSRMEEGEAIYLWLGVPGIDEPRSYVLPWNQRLARQLRGAERTAQQNGAQVRMRSPFERSLDEREQKFYAAPPPPPPLKRQPAENPLNFRHSGPNAGSSLN
ncbi:MAG: hypothetical protein ACE5GS_13430 [Kiloniellaceae bacterium]